MTAAAALNALAVKSEGPAEGRYQKAHRDDPPAFIRAQVSTMVM
jgi:hypothetical protein